MRNGIQWSEAARVLLIEAVIQVEEIMFNDVRGGEFERKSGRPSIPTGRASKWTQINDLLPLHLQSVRTWNPHKCIFNQYKCSGMFGALVSAYKDWKSCKRATKLLLSKPVLELMKKREDLLKAHTSKLPAGDSLRPSSGKVNTNTHRWPTDQKQISPSKSSFMDDPHTKQGHSIEAQSTDTADERTTVFFSESDDRVSTESPQNSLPVANNAEDMEADHENSEDSYTAEYFFESEPEDPAIQKRPAASNLGPASEPVRKCKGPGFMSSKTQIKVQAAAQAHRQERDHSDSSAGRPASDSPAYKWSGKRDCFPTACGPRHGKRPSLDAPLRRIDLEFSRLGSWVQQELVRIGKMHFFNETTSFATRCAKRRNLNAGAAIFKPLDDLIQEDLNRSIDLRIQASFQKLRHRFSVELKNTSVELAQEFRDDTTFVSCSRDSSHGGRRSRHCPPEGGQCRSCTFDKTRQRQRCGRCM